MFVWSRNGANKTKAFVKGFLAPEMKILGGANKWEENGFLLKSVSTPLIEGLDECEMSIENIDKSH